MVFQKRKQLELRGRYASEEPFERKIGESSSTTSICEDWAGNSVFEAGFGQVAVDSQS